MKKTLFTAFMLFMHVMVSGQTQEQLAIKKQIQHELHHPEIIKKSYSNISKSSAYNFYGESPDWNWSQTFGGWGVDYINDIKTDEIGNYYICGSFSGEISYNGNTYNSSGFKDGFIAKFNSSWELQWFKQIEAETTKKVEINSISLDNNNIYATGSYTGSLDINGSPLPGETYKSLLLLALDHNGQFQMQQKYTVEDKERSGKKIITDANNDIYILGTHNILKYNSNGDLLFELEEDEFFNDFLIMNNHLYFAGYTESSSGTLGTIPYSGDNMIYYMFFLAKANLEGDFEFVKIPEHTQPSTASRIFKMDCDSNLNLYLTGDILGALTLDTVNISGNNYQSFLLKTDSAATGKWDITLNEFNVGSMPLAVRTDSSSVLLANSKLLSVNSSGELAPENQPLDFTDKTIYYDPTLENLLIAGGKNGGLYEANYDNTLALVSDVSFTNNTGNLEFAGIVNDSLGNIYTYGYANGQNTFLGEQLETGVFLAKQDKEGTLLWLKNISKAETAGGIGDRIVIDPTHENIYIAGWFSEEISIPGGTTLVPGSTPSMYIVKYDANGNFRYQKSFDDLDKNIDLSADYSGNLILTNTFSGSIQIGAEVYDGSMDVIIVKLNTNGTIDWSMQAGGESVEYDGLSSIDKNDNIFFTGEFTSQNVTIGDSSRTLLDGDGNIFLAKIRTDGYIYWTKSHGKTVAVNNPYNDYRCWPTSIITMPDGYSYIKGCHGDSVSFSDTVLTNEYGFAYDYFIGLFDPNGDAVWMNTIDEKMYGMDYNQFDYDDEGNIYWGGQLKDTTYFKYYDDEYQYIPQGINDLFIARYNRDGSLEWVKTLKSRNGYARIAGVAVADTNSIYINGKFEDYLAHESNELSAPNMHGFLFRMGKETNNPFNISISSSKIEENLPVDTKIGGFTTSDPNNPDDTHSYTLITGNGSNDADNDKFSIAEDTLYAAVEFDYEVQSALHIYVQTSDSEGNTLAKAFTIEVEDKNEAPTDIELLNNTVAENMPVGTVVGQLSTTDPDAGDEHSYKLILGDGSNDTDNDKFTISENTIYTAEEFDYETQEIYHVYIQTRDTALQSFSKAFEIVVTNEDETTGWQLPGDIPFQVFPNPFNNQLTIHSLENSKVMNNATLEIVSLNGQVLYKQSVSGLNEQTVHPGSLPNGIYILKIDTEQGSYRTKIIKQ